VKHATLVLTLTVASLLPIGAWAATVDPATIPDGTYTVKVEKILDAKHIQVLLDNGSETTLIAGRSSVDFSKVRPDDQLKLSLIKGSVMVYADLTSHT
jgi:translation initiation factor IF-1